MIQTENRQLFLAHNNPMILLSVTGGSLLSEILSYPVDRIKARLMGRSQNMTKSLFHISEIRNIYNDIIRTEGPNGLYHGFTAALDRSLTLNLSRFYAYWLLLLGTGGNEYLSLLFAVNICTVLTQPSNVTKLLAQTEELGTSNVRVRWSEKLKNIWISQERSNAFIWRPGARSYALLSNLLAFSEVALYRQLRQQSDESEEVFSGARFRSREDAKTAFYVACLTSVIFNPLEVLHTRMVLRSLHGFPNVKMADYLQNFVKKEGVSGFYKGLLPNIASRSVSLTAMMYFLKEMAVREV